jgi:filamentous hemagglutinin
MLKSNIESHLSKFDEGAIRFTRQTDIERFGTIGPAGGTFVMPKSEFDALLGETKGDLSLVEQKLGLNVGVLSSGRVRAVFIKPIEMKNLRIPSGNEAGTNSNWIPGGKTQGGVTEAVIDVPENLNYIPLKF